MKIFCLLTCLLLAPCARVHAEFAQLGPVETLDNGRVTLQVALRVGRIVSFHRPGEPDWLIVHDEVPHPGWNWNPWGGDRMWPTSQTINPQIYKNEGFDPVIDGQSWELVSKTATSLVMRSGISPQLGLRVTHCIELIGKTTEVLHTYRVERLSNSNFPVHVWTVTGVRAGETILMESDPRVGHYGYKPFKPWTDGDYTTPSGTTLVPNTRILQIPWPKKGPVKLGTYGRWIALVSNGSAFWQSIDYDPDAFYLEASSLQAFIDITKDTQELETLSPTWMMSKGETREWTVRWRLLDFPSGAKSVSERASFLAVQTKIP